MCRAAFSQVCYERGREVRGGRRHHKMLGSISVLDYASATLTSRGLSPGCERADWSTSQRSLKHSNPHDLSTRKQPWQGCNASQGACLSSTHFLLITNDGIYRSRRGRKPFVYRSGQLSEAGGDWGEVHSRPSEADLQALRSARYQTNVDIGERVFMLLSSGASLYLLVDRLHASTMSTQMTIGRTERSLPASACVRERRRRLLPVCAHVRRSGRVAASCEHARKYRSGTRANRRLLPSDFIQWLSSQGSMHCPTNRKSKNSCFRQKKKRKERKKKKIFPNGSSSAGTQSDNGRRKWKMRISSEGTSTSFILNKRPDFSTFCKRKKKWGTVKISWTTVAFRVTITGGFPLHRKNVIPKARSRIPPRTFTDKKKIMKKKRERCASNLVGYITTYLGIDANYKTYARLVDPRSSSREADNHDVSFGVHHRTALYSLTSRSTSPSSQRVSFLPAQEGGGRGRGESMSRSR